MMSKDGRLNVEDAARVLGAHPLLLLALHINQVDDRN